jgi:hypothetical protein
MKAKKNTITKRVSNRRYPERLCKKPDCQEGFVPSDARQLYCCAQHRVDFNNDNRKLKEAFTVCFLKGVKSNRDILQKIENSYYYKKYGCIPKLYLDYEEYDFSTYQKIMINEITGNDVHVCFDYTLELIDPIKQIFLIKNTLDYEL